MDETKLDEFVEYASRLEGYEKGEAHLFLERLFLAFGHKGIVESEATLESKIKIDTRTKFCDLLWPGVVLIEMKSRGEKLQDHIPQVKAYWDNTYGGRPEYVVLCNFDEFWVYNWNVQRDPLDKVPVPKLRVMWKSLAFLCPERVRPVFGNNLVEVTKEAADKIAKLYSSLIKRGIERSIAQRFTLQCLVSLFAEDTGLFPEIGLFSDIVEDCRSGQSTYDMFTLLFKQMNSKDPASGGKLRGVKYFDGGILSVVNPVELSKDELDLLSSCTKYDWSKVQPSIFGNIFEDSLGEEERHATGAHYTIESDIMRIVGPTIIRPWRERISSASTLAELNQVRSDLSKFKILDPACGSGNFLYVSFRELKYLELDLFKKILDNYPSISLESLHSGISGSQFYGIDTNSLGIELAKITLSMAKVLAAREFNKFTKQHRFYDEKDEPLPFDNLDSNFLVSDALFVDWPKADAIIGNPPFQSKNKMQEEFGRAYLNRLHDRYPGIPGLADYCVYWLRKAHDVLPENGRGGLVGTNTIRQTYSRVGGLDYIVSNGGTIAEAVSTMPWSGKAVVHVSIVNWVKGSAKGRKRLAIQKGEKKDGPWQEFELDTIPSSLSPFGDVTKARSLKANEESHVSYQGQTHGHEGFLLTTERRTQLVSTDSEIKEVTFPYLIADELLGEREWQPSRYVIDFQQMDMFQARRYKSAFDIVEETVLPSRKEAYDCEQERNAKALAENPRARINSHHRGFYEKWWQLSFGRAELLSRLASVKRYIVCSRVTKRPIFEFVSGEIRPNDSLQVFVLDDDYSYGILQSTLHWEWFRERCSTLKADFRYTSNTVFDSFPWPQWGSITKVTGGIAAQQGKLSKLRLAREVAGAARRYRTLRNRIRRENGYSLRELYRVLELPGDNPLLEAQMELDQAVWGAYCYGIPRELKRMESLEFVLRLNELCALAEEAGNAICEPGLPSFCKKKSGFYSNDCLEFGHTMRTK
jgi:hypothetical protein